MKTHKGTIEEHKAGALRRKHKGAIATLRRARKHHIDRRAGTVIDASDGDDDDELLDTRQIADWLGVSTQWLEIGRVRGYGPTYIRVAPRTVRYKRSDVLAWLETRKHQSTQEYAS
jgi:predicted DNA-binding transcriptional regulator AlpA